MAHFHKQEKLPVYQSIIGLTLILTSLILWSFYRQNLYSAESSLAAAASIYKYLFQQFVSFKAFTLASFLFGLHSFFCSSTHVLTQSKFKRSILPLLFVAFAGLFQPMFWGALPLLFMLVFLAYTKPLHSIQLFTLTISSLLLALITAGFWGIPELQHGAFYALSTIKNPMHLLTDSQTLFFIPEHVFNWFYGFSLMFLGYSAGKAKVLLHYPFYYTELKRMFKLSLALIVLWILLTLFGAYQLIMHWRLGQLFYLIDALSVCILLSFTYVFSLIFLENFGWGKKILGAFVLLGKYGYVSLMYLAISYKLLSLTTLFNTVPGSWLLLVLQPVIMLLLSLVVQRAFLHFKKESF